VDQLDYRKLKYQIGIDDIRFSKNQMWRALHLTIIANASLIVALASACNPYTGLLTYLRPFLFVPTLLGILYIAANHCYMLRYRNELHTEDRAIRSELNIEESRKARDKHLGKQFWIFTLPFHCLVALSAVILFRVVFPDFSCAVYFFVLSFWAVVAIMHAALHALIVDQD
jgi:hypothetical protein